MPGFRPGKVPANLDQARCTAPQLSSGSAQHLDFNDGDGQAGSPRRSCAPRCSPPFRLAKAMRKARTPMLTVALEILPTFDLPRRASTGSSSSKLTVPVTDDQVAEAVEANIAELAGQMKRFVDSPSQGQEGRRRRPDRWSISSASCRRRASSKAVHGSGHAAIELGAGQLHPWLRRATDRRQGLATRTRPVKVNVPRRLPGRQRSRVKVAEFDVTVKDR